MIVADHTGQSDEFTFQVRSSNHPLRVAMSYSDYPGASLVNNLNLLLIDPQGRYYVGNGTSGNLLVMDTRNNVEVIRVRRPRSGSWKLRIIASQVPHGPQEYAFVLSGHVTALPIDMKSSRVVTAEPNQPLQRILLVQHR